NLLEGLDTLVIRPHDQHVLHDVLLCAGSLIDPLTEDVEQEGVRSTASGRISKRSWEMPGVSRCYSAPRAARKPYGFVVPPLMYTSKCRWHPCDAPVLPAYAITCPALTC